MRNHDFVPAGWLDDHAGGGAEPFLRFIRDELMPVVGAAYRVDPDDTAFWGDSLGGLFGLYVLLNHPGTFSRYVLGSPWIDRADHPVFECERAYAASHADLPACTWSAPSTTSTRIIAACASAAAVVRIARAIAGIRVPRHGRRPHRSLLECA